MELYFMLIFHPVQLPIYGHNVFKNVLGFVWERPAQTSKGSRLDLMRQRHGPVQ